MNEWNLVAGITLEEAQTRKFAFNTVNAFTIIIWSLLTMQFYSVPKVVMPLVNDLFYGDIDGLLLITLQNYKSLLTLT